MAVNDHTRAGGFCSCCGVPYPCAAVRKGAEPATTEHGATERGASERGAVPEPRRGDRGERENVAGRAQDKGTQPSRR